MRDELPDAAVTVDRFHMIRPANRALTEVRRRLEVVERGPSRPPESRDALAVHRFFLAYQHSSPGEYGTAHNREGLGIRTG